MENARNQLDDNRPIYRLAIGLLLTLAVLLATSVATQSVDRASLLQEIIALKARAGSETDPDEKIRLTELLKQKELLFLAPADSDREAFSSLLKQPNTGICRLMPRESFDGVLSMRGGGAYYSFVRQENPYGFGSDLELQMEKLSVGFAGADFGFLTKLRNVSLENVTRESPGVGWLSNFAPPLDEPGARQQQLRAWQGFTENGYNYIDHLPMEIGVPYALRSVSYSNADTLVVFQTHRRDMDGSVILAWRVLNRFVTPQLDLGVLATVSAASYRPSNFAKNMIVSAIGNALATGNFVATSIPLPLELGGVSISIADSSGRSQFAPLFSVTPYQVNFLIPPETAEGYALIMLQTSSREVYHELNRIAQTAPSLFSANADGQGAAAALAFRVRGEQQTYEPVARFEPSQGKFVPIPIDLGADGEQVFLLLYGSGVRGRSSLQNVSVKIGGIDLAPIYAGKQGQTGLDQVNIPLSRSLAGLGEVDVELRVDGQAANIVRVSIK